MSKTPSIEQPGPVSSPQTPLALPRIADLVIATLCELGVKTFYGVPGGAVATLYDALLDAPSARIINTRHETGAAYMAAGQARVGGGLAAVLMTSGPGITNALTGLATAYADGLPLIAIGGEVPRRNFGRGALQEGSRYHLDVLGMVRSVTKMAVEVSHAGAAVSLVQKAVATALSGKQGPVFLTLPLDVANERIEASRTSTQVHSEFDLDPGLVRDAGKLLRGAKRGLILLGSGGAHPESVRHLRMLAEKLGMPVATTPKGKGLFPESHPLSLGVFGFGGHPSATEYLEKGVDVILCVGSGLGETGTNSWSPALKASRAFIQVDIDAAQLGRNYRVDLGIVGPAHRVLPALSAQVEGAAATPMTVGGVRYLEPDRNLGVLHPADVLAGLQKAFGPRAIFTADIGEHTIFALHHLKVDEPDGFLVATGLGAMGSGIGLAIGAKLAKPDRPVVSVCGDYGFQMYGMELATCVQEKLGVVFAIFNDARMRMVESGLTRIFGRTAPMHSDRIDFAALARAVGAVGISIQSIEDLERLAVAPPPPDRPCVLDIAIDPQASFPNHGRIAQIKNFSA